jgi:hypothetical protein
MHILCYDARHAVALATAGIARNASPRFQQLGGVDSRHRNVSVDGIIVVQDNCERGAVGRLKVNLLIGIGVTAFAYSVLFAWSTVRTVYDDHHDSTGRWRAVVNEKNTLKGMLQVRDAYIKRLEAGAATKPSVIQTTKFVPQPKKCWVDSVGKYPNPQTGHTVALVTLHCNWGGRSASYQPGNQQTNRQF